METKEGYQSTAYQRTAAIESQLFHGMDISDRYDREVDFVVRSAHVDFKEGEKALDFACGAGEHALRLSKELGVKVDARDYSQALIGEAKRRKELSASREATNNNVHFAVGNMLDVKGSIEEGSRYKLVTILGSSFMYLGSKANHQKALKEFYEILEPGGKLVIQFRQRFGPSDSQVVSEWEKRSGCKGEMKRAKHPRRIGILFGKKPFGIYARDGEEVYTMTDNNRRDGFYHYHANPVLPTEEISGLNHICDAHGRIVSYNDSQGRVVFTAKYDQWGRLQSFTDTDGVNRSAFGRAFFDASGNEEDLGVAQINHYMTKEGYDRALKAMIEKAGFQNIRLVEEPLSPDSKVMQFAIVAEKPLA